MNRRILVLGGLVIMIVAVVLLTLFTRRNSGGASCENFIAAIQKNDAQKSYNMFTDHAKTFMPYDQWQKTTQNLYGLYGTNKPKQQSHDQTIDPTNNAKQLNEVWVVSDGVNSYTVNCTLAPQNGKYLIDNFSSQVKYK